MPSLSWLSTDSKLEYYLEKTFSALWAFVTKYFIILIILLISNYVMNIGIGGAVGVDVKDCLCFVV